MVNAGEVLESSLITHSTGKAASTSLISVAIRRPSLFHKLLSPRLSSPKTLRLQILPVFLRGRCFQSVISTLPSNECRLLRQSSSYTISFLSLLSSLILNLLFSSTPPPPHSSQFDTPSFHLNLPPSSSAAPSDHVAVML